MTFSVTSFQISKDSSLPLHAQLLDELRDAILNGKLKPHDRLPGELEFVTELGISRATVQRAWQAAQEEGLIYRVTGKGTYVAEPQNAEARMTIGFLIPEFRGSFAGHLLNGAEQVVRANGYRLLYAHTDRRIDEENRLLQQMCDESVAGILIWPAMGSIKGRFLADIRNVMPAVLMDRPISGLPLPCVTSRNHTGGLQAMRHLLELGHRRIIFLSRPHLELWPVAERLRAYEDAMRSAGLEPLPPMLIGKAAELSSYEAYTKADDDEIQPLIETLQTPDRPTAVFAINDWMAFKVLRAASHIGLRVPQDLSLVGFDNMELSELIDPPLTTVAQNPLMIGAEAARRLLAMIGGETTPEMMTQLPTQLIVRKSTMPPST